jgi:ABC-2 type transport system ATP-binding protein
MHQAIEINGLRKAYGDVEAVRDISFSVAAGEVFCLLGPNGAGKTTTTEILEGYRARSAGEVRVLGHDPEDGVGRPGGADGGGGPDHIRALLPAPPAGR